MSNTKFFNQTSSNERSMYIKIFTAFFLIGFMASRGTAQTSTTGSISMAAGASYSIAPTLTVGNTETSGNFYSIYGDLIINEKIIGRAQYSQLITNSLPTEFGRHVDSGFAINGSIGYNFSLASLPKLHIPIMATAGYASIDRSSGFDNQGMQIGATLAPKYYFTDRIIANVTFRILKGTKVDQGSKLGQTDISIGALYRFL